MLNIEDIESWEYVEQPVVYDLTIKDTHNYYLDCGYPVLVHNSSKTYSVLQLLLMKCYTAKRHISITSQALPHLKKGALKDWLEILMSAGIYNEAMHNKTDNIFKVGNSTVEFFSLDMPGKARGPRRDILFINEANLISYETFKQLSLRTKEMVFIDYNPSDQFHWIYDHVLTREDCTYIQSTYKDNPFLPATTIAEIERYKDIDENYWRVYGLGERGQTKETIYRLFKMAEYPAEFDEIIYGLDFGFNNPTALVKIGIKDGAYYVFEMLYQSGLTNPDVIKRLDGFGIGAYATIYADAAEPDRIEEIYRAGYNVVAADKSVKDGIDEIRVLSQNIFTNPDNINFNKENTQYKYKVDKNENVLEEPVKAHDHSMDALRYAIHTHKKRGNGGVSW